MSRSPREMSINIHERAEKDGQSGLIEYISYEV